MSKGKGLPSRVLALGATSAIAEATLRPLAESGASFFLVARNAQKLSAVSDDLLTRGASAVTAYVMDLDDTAAHPAMLEKAAESLGTIDLALLAHGVLGEQADAEASYAAAEAILRTNFMSAVSLITWLANYFEASRQGCLAVISSVAGDRGRKSNYVYGASKGALNVFVDGVRNRIDRSGVHVLTIKPGFVATPMTAHIKPNPLFAQPEQVAKDILGAIRKRKDVIYTPPFWAIIMLILRSVPRSIFKKLNV
ncbi:SDR family oxidoreductase [Paracidobacterium acidisoli]|uniref:SDR family oxidoreductase n=1 Tax=Paracidobacterium acidisoli TaxID=2303751 RepID=A0A372INC7_9BACT|nr:SDR family oxidoreductase [Paracidobacterium acidisoli]MBT9331723.1 SDR family oxidoreductase [Paracidobacterium acidisoli]